MNLFDKYGIKEVADVAIYKLESDGTETPFLFLDTLKVSTLEQTAEQAEAKGGKGNPSLIMWDYNKEINVTLEDALFSPKSMALMWGGKKSAWANATTVKRTVQAEAKSTTIPTTWTIDNKTWTVNNVYNAAGTKVTTSLTVGETYLLDCSATATNGSKLTIEANDFPGTYKLVGDTYVRDTNGNDSYFQFIINKAKMSAEQTLTLEAEGDPTTFNLNMKVLRPDDATQGMIEFVKYDIA